MRTRDENKEQAICEKALELIVKKGLDGLSMQKLAKAAKVSPATIYIYFKDREDLIIQLCVRESEKMIAATLNNFNPEMSFAEGLKIQWKNRASYWLKNPVAAQFLEQIKHSPYGEKSFEKVKRDFSQTMGTFLHGAIKRKELVPVSIEVYWSIAYAPLYQLVKFHQTGKGLHRQKFELDDKTLNQSLKLVLKALTP